MLLLNVNAVIAPTPGMVISSPATGSAAALAASSLRRRSDLHVERFQALNEWCNND